MTSIPAAPPPPPSPQRVALRAKASPSPPPPPPPRPPRQTTDFSAIATSSQASPTPTSRPPPPPTVSAPAGDIASKDAAAEPDVKHVPSELVTSSVSTTSPKEEADSAEAPSRIAQSAPPSGESNVTTPATPTPPRLNREDAPPEQLVPRPAIMHKSEGVLSTSSVASSPRRPRRAGTGIPANTRVSDLEFEVSDDIGPSARDEFEEEFLNGNASDRESQMISDVLERVDFRQLSDDEEILSDDAADSSRGEAVARRQSEQAKQRRKHMEFDSLDLQRIRQSTAQSNWQRIPSEVGCEGCGGCTRLCIENRKLRRQLDELEFELASGVLHNPPDGFEPPQVVKTIPAIPQIPVVSKKKKGWTNKLRNATALSIPTSKPGEKSRLKDEVQALSVTTEYLWRKLNKAENELRNYRLRDLRNRMRMSEAQQTANDIEEPRGQHSESARSKDWDWE